MKLSDLIISDYTQKISVKEHDFIAIHNNKDLLLSEKMDMIDKILGEILFLKQKLELFLDYTNSKEENHA